MTATIDNTDFARLSRDIRKGVATLGPRQARYLVDMYYQMQDYRIASNNQARSMTADEEPHETINFFASQMQALENQIKRVLDDWTDTEPSRLGQWARSITGVGPVIAAGLLAHIDINKATTAGKIWRYAGLDPTIEWRSSKDCHAIVNQSFDAAKATAGDYYDQKLAALQDISEEFGRSVPNLLNLLGAEYTVNSETGEVVTIISDIDPNELAKKLAKRPWNASLKVVCWKLGESFVKVSGNPNDYYGKIYQQRKEFEQKRNEEVEEVHMEQIPYELRNEVFEIEGRKFRGGNGKQAADILQKKRIGKDTDAYKAYSVGKLPPAHIHARAKRYAVKMFLAHYHEVGRKLNGLDVPVPYVIEHMGHKDYIAPPNFPMD